ncbi:MAG: insulinase family protein [Clostridia bacterium]|nr:insulinase family protein [Clostridia bacterium]
MAVDFTVLSSGAEGLFIKKAGFKTTLVSFNFYLPLKREKVASFALLPFILTTCSNKYPDFRRLNIKLSKLYGAELSASAEKVGDYQLLKMSISVIGDKYTLDNEQLTNEAISLLTELVFEPKVIDGEFSLSDLEREKRKAIEHIKGEFAEKRIYAKNRLIEEMYKDSPYGITKCGRIEDVEKIDGKSLYSAWEEMLKTAHIRVNVVSDTMPQGLFDELSERLSKIDRTNVTDLNMTEPTAAAKKVSRIVETQELKQGKLCMGFTFDKAGSGFDTADMLVCSDIFGGGPYSKLFANVREKMSLCYYCAARSIRIKGLLTVESGIEKENAEKAEKAILAELKNLQKGDISDTQFNSSILGITDSLKTYNDSSSALEGWYALTIFSDDIFSPEEFAESIKKVTKEAVVEVAEGIKLHTVLKLLPKEEKA